MFSILSQFQAFLKLRSYLAGVKVRPPLLPEACARRQSVSSHKAATFHDRPPHRSGLRECNNQPYPGVWHDALSSDAMLIKKKTVSHLFYLYLSSLVAFITLPNLSLSALSLSHGLSGVDINLRASYRLAGLATFGRSFPSPPYCR